MIKNIIIGVLIGIIAIILLDKERNTYIYYEITPASIELASVFQLLEIQKMERKYNNLINESIMNGD